MCEEALLFSDNIDDLIFARRKTRSIIRYASDLNLLSRILKKFDSHTVLLKNNSNSAVKSLLKESLAVSYEFSSKEELGNLVETVLSKEESNEPKITENYENLSESCPYFGSLAGNSVAMQKLRSEIIRIARFDVSVLLLGETGTGKTTVAHAIHELSARNKKPFKFAVLSNSNESHIEAKLFGVSEGGFTGAVAGKGLFEEADGGTLFLDEIGEISPNIQTKLLQVLSEGIINRIGSNKDIQVDNRMIFATNANLEAKIKLGNFRTDLFYRINDVTIQIPPLRERLEDIPAIAKAFLKRERIDKEISQSALDTLQTFTWKGNVRQLEKCIKNAALLYCNGSVIEPRHLKL